jgi:hypothetical protein
MNATRKRGDVVTVDQLPAVEKPGRRWKMLDALARDADELVERYDQLSQTARSLMMTPLRSTIPTCG